MLGSRVYAENANMAAYAIEGAMGAYTGYTLLDDDTVRLLAMESGALVPEVPYPKTQRAKDVRWNRQRFRSAITQGILQGESVPKVAKRVQSVVGMDSRAATRAARTALTGAQNAGRVNAYGRMADEGCRLKQEWMATRDVRTRDSHRKLDGERVEIGGSWQAERGELRFPGDPQAHPAETWNCRCRVRAVVDGIDQDTADRFSRLPAGTTYEQWKAGKAKLGLGSGGDADNVMRRIGTIDVSDDAAVRAYVEKVKAEIRNEPVEHAIVIQKDGVVMRGSGNGTSVSLDESTVEGATVIHNHPTKDGEHIAPGADDYAVLLEQKPRTLIAVDSEYDYSLEPGSTKSVSYNEAYRNGLNPFGDADQQHNIMEWLNDNGYVRYSREAVRSDGRASR